MGILYIVATPIGNLQDLTFRALEALKSADLIVAEDTRTARSLLTHFGIKKDLISYFAQSSEEKIREIVGYIKNGKNIYEAMSCDKTKAASEREKIDTYFINLFL